MGGGYQGGNKTVLPREAFAKLIFRLVPNQRPEEILRLAEAHLQAHCPKGVRLEILPGHCGEPYYVDPYSVYGKASLRALKASLTPTCADARGWLDPHRDYLQEDPWRRLVAPCPRRTGLRAHSPNENFPIENFFAGMRLNQAIVEEIGRLK
jgi:acetylornithine deacetylase/succinyl-diaminopimelate desuccinylase-like protein